MIFVSYGTPTEERKTRMSNEKIKDLVFDIEMSINKTYSKLHNRMKETLENKTGEILK